MRMLNICIHFSSILFMGLFIWGCGLFSDNGDGIHIKTDKDHYIIEPSAIKLSVENQSDKSVYYICTGQVWLQEISENKVVNSWQVHGFEKCLARVPIEPDKSHTFELQLVSEAVSSIDQMADSARFDDSVRYRFEVDLYNDLELEEPLGEENRLSNQLSIVR